MRWKILVGMVASALATVIIIALLIHMSGRLGGISAAFRRAPADELPALPRFPVLTMEPTVREQFSAVLGRLGLEPRDAEANGTLGMLYHAYGFFALAEPCYRRATLLAPDQLRWRYYLGRVLAGQGDWDGAAAELDRVLAARPDDLPSLLYRAEADRRRNRLDEANRGYARVRTLAPRTAQAHCGAGQVALRAGDLTAAVVHLETALRLAPAYGTAHYALGQALRKLGRLDEARAQLARAEQHRDQEPPLEDVLMRELEALRTGAVDCLHRGIALAQRGRYDAAVELFEQATRIDPKLAEAHAQLGAALLARGDLEAARLPLRRAIGLEPSQADALYNLGLLEHRQGAFGTAVEHFRHATDVRPDHFEAHLGLGTDLPHLGRHADAVTHLRIALALRPNDARPYKRLGRALATAGDCPGAIAVLRRGTQRLARDASVADRLAWTLVTCDPGAPHDAAEAVRIAEDVCRRTGNAEPRALATRAAALAALGRFDEAIASAEQALDLARRQAQPELEQEIEIHLAHYRAGRSYRARDDADGDTAPPNS